MRDDPKQSVLVVRVLERREKNYRQNSPRLLMCLEPNFTNSMTQRKSHNFMRRSTIVNEKLHAFSEFGSTDLY